MLDLNTLKNALKPLSEMGREEFTFEVDDISVTLRPLLPLEEVQVQRYAASVLEDIQAQEGLSSSDNMSRAAAMDYFDRFRIEIIANAIVQVNDLDLRNEKYIATGETLENGTPVQVPRGIAMRGIVQEWSRAMITVCFTRYGDLVQKIADEADKIAQTTLPDLDAEIERVEARLKTLKQDRETRAKGDPSITAHQITKLVEAGKALEEQSETAAMRAEAEAILARERREAAIRDPEQQGKPIEEPAEPVVEQKAAPEPSVEEQVVVPEAPVVHREQRKSVIPQSSPPPSAFPSSSGTPVPGEMMSSFGDGDNPQVLAAEEARIMEARRQAALAAQSAATEARDPFREAVEVASPEQGVEAYRLPKEELTPRGRESAPSPKKGARKGKGKGKGPRSTENPNFKPSR